MGLGKIYIQCKRHRDTIQAKDVKEFLGTLHTKNTKKGIFITTSRFAKGAKDCVQELKTDTTVILIDGQRLVDLMAQHKVGVYKGESITLYRINKDYFENLD